MRKMYVRKQTNLFQNHWYILWNVNVNIANNFNSNNSPVINLII